MICVCLYIQSKDKLLCCQTFELTTPVSISYWQTKNVLCRTMISEKKMTRLPLTTYKSTRPTLSEFLQVTHS